MRIREGDGAGRRRGASRDGPHPAWRCLSAGCPRLPLPLRLALAPPSLGAEIVRAAREAAAEYGVAVAGGAARQAAGSVRIAMADTAGVATARLGCSV